MTTIADLLTHIERRLPEKGDLLLLSETGSIPFGWGNPDEQDWDVHGIYYAPDWWDWVHDAWRDVDLNLWEVRTLKRRIDRPYVEYWVNMAAPLYADDRFDWQGFMDLLDRDGFPYHAITRQVRSFEHDGDPRTALHAYRLMLSAVHFDQTGDLVVDVVRLNDAEYGLEGMRTCVERYRSHRPLDEDERTQVEVELHNLQSQTAEILTDPAKPKITSRRRDFLDRLYERLQADTPTLNE